MPYLAHFSDELGAQQIIRNGKINASLDYLSGGDTAFGNGVYLTGLDPGTHTPAEIAINNWMDDSPEFIRKAEYHFVLDIPDSDVEDYSTEDRNIFLYGWKSDLRLWKYPWWLMRFGSNKVIASYKYQLTSFGPASEVVPNLLRDYTMIDETVNGRPVYESSRGSYFLFMDSEGSWMVREGDFKDEDGIIGQLSDYSLGPDEDVGWSYYDSEEDEWMNDDGTLKSHGWQK